jgi:methylenetetrahydrofolate reductase (NADPH)
MQFIRDIHAAKLAARQPVVSFEFFPPKTDEGDRALLEKTIPALLKLKPDFCSVTYGAGGSTRDKTLMIVDRIQREHRLTAMLHLTCVNSTQDQLAAVVTQARSLNIRNVLALRGDPVAGTNSEFKKTEGGFEFSHELVTFLKGLGGFSIGTAGFPEGHVACKEGKFVDWQRLKNKIDCGADFVITQLFFDNADFFEFRDHLVRMGVTVPIVPGIIPILSTAQIKRFTALCGAKLPSRLLESLEGFGDDDEATTKFGIDYATQQCAELLKAGAPGLHFYTLNKARATTEILKGLKLG